MLNGKFLMPSIVAHFYKDLIVALLGSFHGMVEDELGVLSILKRRNPIKGKPSAKLRKTAALVEEGGPASPALLWISWCGV